MIIDGAGLAKKAKEMGVKLFLTNIETGKEVILNRLLTDGSAEIVNPDNPTSYTTVSYSHHGHKRTVGVRYEMSDSNCKRIQAVLAFIQMDESRKIIEEGVQHRNLPEFRSFKEGDWVTSRKADHNHYFNGLLINVIKVYSDDTGEWMLKGMIYGKRHAEVIHEPAWMFEKFDIALLNDPQQFVDWGMENLFSHGESDVEEKKDESVEKPVVNNVHDLMAALRNKNKE